jgi:aminopeptidase N
MSGLLAQFPADEFYLSDEAIRDALVRKGQFNIIHPTSGLKIDVIIQQGTAFEQSRFTRARLVHFTDLRGGRFAAPEDVILKKMAYYREGGSEKHLRDIAGIMKVSAHMVDVAYITEWAGRLGVEEIWRAVQRRLQEGD